MRARATKIQEQYRDSDGYWVYLLPGYQDRYNPGCHTIVEDTKRDALGKAKDAIPCDCADCQAQPGYVKR